MTHLKFEEVVESASCSFSQMLFNACLKCKKIAHPGCGFLHCGTPTSTVFCEDIHIIYSNFDSVAFS